MKVMGTISGAGFTHIGLVTLEGTGQLIRVMRTGLTVSVIGHLAHPRLGRCSR